MIASRRVRSNFALQRAVHWALTLGRPLLVLEALRCDYRWASDRLHRFVLEGMRDNRRALRDVPVRYYAYIEPQRGAGSGLIEALLARTSLLVTDDFPCFFLPRMTRAVAERSPVLVEAVDANGLLPLRAADRVFQRAHDFRRFLQRELRAHLQTFPRSNPFPKTGLSRADVPAEILSRWPEASDELLEAPAAGLARLPIDHAVGPAAIAGGSQAAGKVLRAFVTDRLPRYAAERSDPDADVSSGLSPYLHFGQISTHEVFRAIAERENWHPDRISARVSGSREGWWGMSSAAEGFLDELITWRELGYNFCWQRDDYDCFDSLPDWARQTLEDHADDPRAIIYALEQFEFSGTHDRLWNAAQRQLVTEGRMHNYLRMLWGKKILEWSESPRQAAQIMIHLNNKYAIDGRDPNSYSGIFWVLGRYDRPWGPERPIFGKVRYMSSENTARKLSVEAYMSRHAPAAIDP
jgi:deoxyribodipyrimidine photo-lyase